MRSGVLNVNVSCTYGQPRVLISNAPSPRLGLKAILV